MVRIVYNENIEEAIVAELQTGLAEFGATVTTEKFKTGVLNTWGWWMLPPLLGILIGKPFLDSFFKELGEESAKKFKQLLGSVFTRLKKKGSRFYTAEDFRAIQKGADPQSRGQACPILGIVFEIETTETQKWRLRCLLPANLEESEVDQAITILKQRLPKVISDERRALKKTSKEIKGKTTLVYLPNEGWVSDTLLMQEYLKNKIRAKRTKPRTKSKK